MTTTAIPTQTAAVRHARATGEAPTYCRTLGAAALQELDEALLRDLEDALVREPADDDGGPTEEWWNLAAARDAVADRVVARAGRIDRRRRTAKAAR